MASAVADPPHAGVPARRTVELRWLLAAVAVVAVALDQVTKWWATRALEDGPIEVVGSLRLRLVFNEGGAFSLGRGLAPYLALAAFALVVWIIRTGDLVTHPTAAVAVGCIVGGAFGNLVDRVARDGPGLLGGAVVDFVDLGPWPVFNVADIALTVGGSLLAFTAFGRPAASDG